MKIKRQKHVYRTLLFYKNYFAIEPPFTILLDGTFCKAALSFKINIADQLPKYLDHELKIKTTQCVIRECKSFGEVADCFVLLLSTVFCRSAAVRSVESAAAI
jgi:U3 small nucleolar RNA-associated protein 23